MIDQYVQNIAVVKAGTHEEVVKAVALASVVAYVVRPEEPSWDQWLSGRFTKSVRRGSRAQVREAAILDSCCSGVCVGDAEAYGFLPLHKDVAEPALGKLQVANFERDRTGEWDMDDGGPTLVINESIEMSTGKTAAQAAHGLFGWFLRQSSQVRHAWNRADSPFTVVSLPGDEFEEVRRNAFLTITDAGFTEIPAGSVTVVVVD
jgi:peptidyl-tRNA hydrolase